MSMFDGSAQNRLVWLLLMIISTATADQNPLVSEGTCYYASGKQADSVYIPCGNDAFGVYACCMNGDNCLSSNACYNAQYGDTYIAGCTDSTYSDASCGYKGAYGSLEWASLVRCFVSNDTSTNDEEWAACYESNQPIVTKHDGGCVCTSPSEYVFKDNPSLTNIAVLPAATGQTISFQPGHTPPSDLTPTAQATSSPSAVASSTSSSASTTSPSASSTSTSAVSSSSSPATSLPSTTPSSSSSSSSSSSASASSSSSSSSSSSPSVHSSVSSSSTTTPVTTASHENLSTGAEAGIALGAALVVLLVCVCLFFLYRRRVKKKYVNHENIPQEPYLSPYTDSNTGWSSQNHSQYIPEHGSGAGAATEIASPVWAGQRAKVSAEERSALMGLRPPSELASTSNVSEVEGSSSSTFISLRSSGRYSNPNFTPISNEPGNDSMMGGPRMQLLSQSRMRPGMQTVHELPGSHV